MATSFELVPASPEQLAALRRDLVAVGDRLEAADSPDWLIVARAAALIDGVRFELLSVSGVRHGSHFQA